MFSISLKDLRTLEKQASEITSEWAFVGVPEDGRLIGIFTNGINPAFCVSVRDDYLHLFREEK